MLFIHYVAVIFGAVTILLGLVAKYMGNLVLQIALSIFGFVGGPLTGLLSLGLFCPFVNSKVSLLGERIKSGTGV